MDNKKKEKKLYKISQVMKLLNITGRTIRYYDQFGLLPHVKRSEGRVRLFDEKDIEVIKKIKRLQEEYSMSLDDIKEELFGKKGDSRPLETIVVTDSSAVLPKELVGTLPIHVIPLSIKIGHSTISETELDSKKFLEKTKNLKVKPEVVLPTEDDLISVYRSLAKKGFKRIYSIHTASSLSNMYEIAKSASYKVNDAEVTAIDSKSTGAGLGLLVKLVAEAIVRQDTLQEIDLLIQKHIPLIYYLVMINTLKHFMEKEGAMALDSEVAPKLYQFKPILCLSNATGDIEILECAKDQKTAIEHTIEFLNEEIRLRGNYLKSIIVSYDHLYSEALNVVNSIRSNHPQTEIYAVESSPSLSSYLGYESIGIAII